MNQKRAKKLRREAEALAQASNIPWLNYQADYHTKTYRNIAGETKTLKVFTGYLTDCGRYLYQQLKQEKKQLNN